MEEVFHYYAETGLPPANARGWLLLIGRNVPGASVPLASACARRACTSVKGGKRASGGGWPRVYARADAIDATTEHYREG